MLELGAGHGLLQVLGPALVGGDEGQADGGLLRGREFALGLFAALLETLQGHGIFAEVDAFLLAEFFRDKADQCLVVVVAAEVAVAAGAQDFENVVADIEDRNIKRPAAQIEDGDFLVLVSVQSICE